MADSLKTDEETAEAIKSWLRENGSSLLTGILLGLAVLFGGKAWFAYQERNAMAASHHYSQLAMAVSEGSETLAGAKHEVIITEFPGSTYAVLAGLQIAALHMNNDDPQAAMVQLQWAYEHAEQPGLRHVARIRLARVLIGTGELDRAEALLNGMPSQGPFAASYLELNGDLSLARGDYYAAHAAYEKALEALPANVPGRTFLEAKRDDALRSPAAGSS